MQITPEQIFQTKQKLHEEVQQYEQKLQELVEKQSTLRKIDQLAESILEYDRLEREIEDRSRIFSLLSTPPESLLHPMVKSELFSYFVAAETVGPELVNFLVDDVLAELRKSIQAGEDDSVDLIQAEFKEYVIPGKIIGQKFEEIGSLIEEMNRLCQAIDPRYDPRQAEAVLRYAFELAIAADIRLDPLIQALRHLPLLFLTDADRAILLDRVEERLAILRFEQAKKQNLAMEKAIKILEQREQEDPTHA